jgi:hypothetical protein
MLRFVPAGRCTSPSSSLRSVVEFDVPYVAPIMTHDHPQGRPEHAMANNPRRRDWTSVPTSNIPPVPGRARAELPFLRKGCGWRAVPRKSARKQGPGTGVSQCLRGFGRLRGEPSCRAVINTLIEAWRKLPTPFGNGRRRLGNAPSPWMESNRTSRTADRDRNAHR